MDIAAISGLQLSETELQSALERLCLFGASGSGEYVRELQEFLCLHAMALLDPGFRPAQAIYEKVRSLIKFPWDLEDVLQALSRLTQKGEIECRGVLGQSQSEYRMQVGKISSLRNQTKTQDEFEKSVIDHWRDELILKYPSLNRQSVEELSEDLQLYILRLLGQHAVESLSLYYGDDKDVLELIDKFSIETIKSILPRRSRELSKIRAFEFPRFFKEAPIDRKRYIAEKMNSVFILHLLQLDPTCASLARNQIPGGVLYLDTNFIYRLVGIQGPVLWSSAKRLKDLSIGLGYQMVVSPRTITEYKTSIISSLRRAHKVPQLTPQMAAAALSVSTEDDILTSYWQQIVTKNRSMDPRAFFDYYSQIEDLLSNININIADDAAFRNIVDHDSDVAQEEGILERAVSRHGQQVRHPDISNHDAIHRLLILQLRGGNQNSSFVETRYWWLTCDSKLPKYDRIARLNTKLLTPYCVLASQWLQAMRPLAPSLEGFEVAQVESLDSSFLRIYKSPPSELLNDVMSRLAMSSNYAPQVATKMFLNRQFIEQFVKAPTKEDKDQLVDNFYETYIEDIEKDKGQAIEERNRAIQERDRALQLIEELQTNTKDFSPPMQQVSVYAEHAYFDNKLYKEETMGSKYNISGGNQGAVGDNSSAENFTQVSNSTSQPIDLTQLAQELNRLRMEARKEATEPEHDVAIGELAAAESAAKKGDQGKTMEHLSKAGQWLLDVATKIGTSVAAEVIKKSMFPT